MSLLHMVMAGVVGSAACAPPGEVSTPAGLDLQALPIPALPGSGEPRLSSHGDGVVLSWLEPAPGSDADAGRWRLRMIVLGDGQQAGEASTVVENDSLLVSAADLPSVVTLGDGAFLAHWREKETPTWGVRVSRSNDGGATWSEPLRLHEGRGGENGFVSVLPLSDGDAGLLWLDGRLLDDEGVTKLYARTLQATGALSPEAIVDERVCDCCHTDAAATSAGFVFVYRDRTEGEVRDIHATSLIDGRWTEGRPVYEDGWVIEGCPVNGPAVAARGDRAVVAWFTAPMDEARVQVSFSTDGGASWGPPVRVDAGMPGGRVDVTWLDDESAAVSWVERVAGNAEIRARRVSADGRVGPELVVSHSGEERSSGFPQMIADRDGRVVFAWTDVTGAEPLVRAASVPVDALLRP